MRKLLSANLFCLLHSKAFLICGGAAAAGELLFCMGILKNGSVPMDLPPFVGLQFFGIAAAVWSSMLLGTEYADGTLRNKIITGHKRRNIYFAALIANMAAAALVYLAQLLVGWGFGTMMFAAPQHSPWEILQLSAIGLFACFTHAALYTLVGMLCTNRTAAAIIDLMLSFGLLFLGIYTFQRLMQYDMLSAVSQKIHLLLYDLNPYGQVMQLLASERFPETARLLCCSGAVVLGTVLVGVPVFCRKDLK